MNTKEIFRSNTEKLLFIHVLLVTMIMSLLSKDKKDMIIFFLQTKILLTQIGQYIQYQKRLPN